MRVTEGNRNDKENIGHAVNFDTVITYIAFLTLTMSMNVNQTSPTYYSGVYYSIVVLKLFDANE